MADILPFKKKEVEPKLEQQIVYACSCGCQEWLICKDAILQCSDCGMWVTFEQMLDITDQSDQDA